jgi:hypothetical protein
MGEHQRRKERLMRVIADDEICCETCPYWWQNDELDVERGTGKCIEGPPTVMLVPIAQNVLSKGPMAQQIGMNSYFPPTNGKGIVCGRHPKFDKKIRDFYASKNPLRDHPGESKP